MLAEICKKKYEKDLEQCSDMELYIALLELTKEAIGKRREEQMPVDGKEKPWRKVYYISAEFLLGKLLGNHLINLGIYREIAQELEHAGKSLGAIEELESEPSLGNGGLGRLAACFLDSMATVGIPGDGIGLLYHFGLFKQVFQQNKQTEQKNPWDKEWLIPTGKTYPVHFGDCTVQAVLYDMDVVGYEGRINRLHLFDLETVNEGLVQEQGITFDKTRISGNLTLFLYPDDSDEAGNLLRIYQQYFMVAGGAALILQECKARGCSLRDLPEYAVIQINDTHPSLIIPELIRLLLAEGLTEEEAVDILSRCCAYTNHTILAEALEKWPLEYLEKVVPDLVPIIRMLDRRAKEKYPGEGLAIIDEKDRVHMAHMDIHYGFSVNGVAHLHTEILKNNELQQFYRIYPDKFNNKTNGITFRRWLLHCNRDLAEYIESLIGPGFKQDAGHLAELEHYLEDEQVLQRLLDIKQQDKLALKEYLQQTQGITIDERSVYDIQIKRLHEYKRQQMNALYVIHQYLEIKRGKLPARPITVIFGAKAAPAYTMAKNIIHLLLCLQELTAKDPQVAPYLRVVMVENYNVTKAEKLIPACDISEQISLASKEASGTGNMKFMLNGAVTLGTLDGANVEIAHLVGEGNIYTFGAGSKQVLEHYEKGDYVSKDYYDKSPMIQECVDFLIGKELFAIGDPKTLQAFYQELLGKDWFMTLLDLEDYIKVKKQMLLDYENRMGWARKMLINIARSGFFSSDRTIREYNKDIWKAPILGLESE